MPEIAEGRYYIQLANGKALEASTQTYKSNGARIQLWNLYRGLNQLWEVRPAAAGGHHIVNVGARKALDANRPDVDRNGCRVQLWDVVEGNANQRWMLLPLGGDAYAIRNAASGGNRVLDCKNALLDSGIEIQLWEMIGGANQVWRFVRSSDRAVVTGTSVDLRANQTPIKSQGGRGSCTYFGTTAALEAAYKKAGYGNVNLSEEFWAIMGKALYIHPIWTEITHSNYRENQFGGTQGGGSVRWYPTGFRLPTEADVPYRAADYVPPNWASLSQREANDFNFSLFQPNVLRAPLTYGASTVVKFTDEQERTAAEYERILDLGFEISIGTGAPEPRTDIDGHNMLLVGYDKTDPANPVFWVKNSWGPVNGDPVTYCERRSYSQLLGSHRIVSAEYIADVTTPQSWPELNFLGRWNLCFDGHKGQLDIYHIPGVGNLPFDAPTEIDRRLGVFYDSSGAAFRVNGSVRGNRVEFYFNGSRPNLPWGELTGRSFVYFLSADGQTMSGTHTDGGTVRFGGFATKAAPPRHSSPTRNDFSALAGSRWNLMIGEEVGLVAFGAVNGYSVQGAFTTSSGARKTVEATRLESGAISIWIQGASVIGRAYFLNHESGVLAGSTNDGRILLAWLL